MMAASQQERQAVVVDPPTPSPGPVWCGYDTVDRFIRVCENITSLRTSVLVRPEMQQEATKAEAITSQFLQSYEALLTKNDWGDACRFSFLKNYKDFKELALRCTKTITSELSRDQIHQTFPVDTGIGGLAGGEKRVCFSSVRIKSPKNPACEKNMYDSLDDAAKTYGHELTGVDVLHSAFLKHKTSRHCFIPPPCLVVDCDGARYFVSADLPLHQCTLKVGKSGSTPGFPRYEQKPVQILNAVLVSQGISPHRLTDEVQTTPEGESCALPCDAEVYQANGPASSDKYYIVDTARVVSPRGIRAGEKGKKVQYLVKHFRKEFVERFYRTFGVGLSSDAFFPMSLDEDNWRVQKAEVYYQRTIPQEVAERLETLECAALSEFLVMTAHFHGLNLCDLGEVHNLLAPCSPWRQCIIVEVTARSFRRVVNSEWFSSVQAGTLTEQKRISIAVKCFNLALATAKDSPNSSDEMIWNKINNSKDEHFPALSGVTISRENIVEPETKSFQTFMKVASQLLGITWKEEPWVQESSETSFFSKSKPFECSMVLSVVPRVKEMSLVYRIRSSTPSDWNDEKETIKDLHNALAREPRNCHLLKCLAWVYELLLVSQKGQSVETSRESSVKQRYLSRLALEASCGVPVEEM